MSSSKKLLQAAAGSAGGGSLYVEDVFSTYVYEGTQATQAIDNGIDLAGEGGLVWLKNRVVSYPHGLFDTERGTGKLLQSNATAAELSYPDLTSFNSDGFTVGFYSGWFNNSGQDQTSWTFRKAEKFFDVVTYTGTGSTRTVAHNLGSTPGFIIIKRTSLAEDWTCWHIGVPGAANYIQLNKTDAYASNNSVFNNTAPTDSVFTVGSSDRTNTSGESYVAYLFASDAGGFGDDGDESIIKCGSFQNNGTPVDLGWEPQFLIIKPYSTSASWYMYDGMRGFNLTGSKTLLPNTSGAEGTESVPYTFSPTATGFTNPSGYFGTSVNLIYIAIRRPMKTPESGTEVFAVDQASNSVAPKFRAPFAVDMAWYRLDVSGTELGIVADRLRGEKELNFDTTFSEGGLYAGKFDYMNGWNNLTGANSASYSWMLKRATGFMDVVAYTGDGVAGRTVAHNLGVAPELMIVKSRTETLNWYVYSAPTGNSQVAYLNLTNAFGGSTRWYNTTPTSTQFYLTGGAGVNSSSQNYIAYLFATLAGVSKVGSYTGTGADLNVDCGFSAGARFILIKRTDSTGDWYYWDSVRGIVAGNDSYLLLNSNAAQVTNTDYIDPLSSGFTVTSSAPAALNASGGTYIFLAIA